MSDNDSSSNIKKEKRGNIFFNEKKLTEKSPDLTGRFLLKGEEWKISLWENKNNEGKKYYSFSISEYVPPNPNNSNTQSNQNAHSQAPGGQPIVRPQPTPGAIVDLSSDDLSDIDNILGLMDDDDNNPFN